MRIRCRFPLRYPTEIRSYEWWPFESGQMGGRERDAWKPSNAGPSYATGDRFKSGAGFELMGREAEASIRLCRFRHVDEIPKYPVPMPGGTDQASFGARKFSRYSCSSRCARKSIIRRENPLPKPVFCEISSLLAGVATRPAIALPQTRPKAAETLSFYGPFQHSPSTHRGGKTRLEWDRIGILRPI
jgi:hypothetical protein